MAQQRIAGANMQVEITMPSGGGAEVQGDAVVNQALYYVPVHSANILETISTADATNPRIDQIILEIQDNVHDATGGNLARTRVVAGTPSVGATLANRTGVTTLPGSALLLADVLVGAGAASITNAVIRDRRKWARGASHRILRTSNAAAGNDYTTASAALVDVDATNLAPRLELSGAPVEIRLSGRMTHTTAGQFIGIAFTDNGSLLDGATQQLYQGYCSVAAGDAGPLAALWPFVPAAGSHQLKPQWVTSAATASLLARAGFPLVLSIREDLRQVAGNNSVTTG